MCIIASIAANSIVSWSFCRPGLENKSGFVTDRMGHVKAADISQLIPVKSAFSTSSPDFQWSSPQTGEGYDASCMKIRIRQRGAPQVVCVQLLR